MDYDSQNVARETEPAERRLIAAAWAQFESLATSRKTASTHNHRAAAIPGYRVLRKIHHGGQGVVYQAVQESTGRKVAIKVLKEGPLANAGELARFDREVDILSRLSHPHIVSIHDRGCTATGLAYYVMDYIAGRALDAHVSGTGLSSREMLGLFHKICEAVNAAHLRGVIHRDLKPSNIRVDDEGEPHVLDFGLAKLAPEPEASLQKMTVTGQFLGSLPWASPEQAEGSSSLDIRTDVYSLGVILYHLLTRNFPYPVSGRITEVVQSIVHCSPSRPSAFIREIERDVEIIVLKCLEKDAERRYQSAGELARDLQRYLSAEPIEARPASSYYQLRQFARRNQGLVASVIAIFLTLAAATAVSLVFAYREASAHKRERTALAGEIKERERADREAAQTREVAAFQARMLSEVDPQAMGAKLRADLLTKVRAAAERSAATPQEIGARVGDLETLITGIDLTGLALTALDENVFQKALAAIEKQFGDQPLVEAQLLQTVASTSTNLGLLDAASRPQQEALAIRRRMLGSTHVETLESIGNAGSLLVRQGKLEEAEPYLREALETSRKALGNEHPQTLISIMNMGSLLHAQGKLSEAESCFREALEAYREALGDDHPHTLNAINELALQLKEEGKLAEAEPLYRESLEKHVRVLGAEHPDTITALDNLGGLLQAQGRLSEAEPYHREALEKRRRVQGDEHPYTLTAINNMGELLKAQGKVSEAEPYYREALEKRRRLLGNEHPDTLLSLNNTGLFFQAQGRFSEAEPIFREALEACRRTLGNEHADTLIAVNSMGILLQTQGNLAGAEVYFREAVEGFRRTLGDEHFYTLVAIGNLGRTLVAADKSTEAASLLAEAEPAARRTFTSGHAMRLARFLTSLGRARAGTKDFGNAEADLTEAHRILSESHGATDQDRANVRKCLAELYAAWHAADPTAGHDAEAAHWRAELEHTTTSSGPKS